MTLTESELKLVTYALIGMARELRQTHGPLAERRGLHPTPAQLEALAAKIELGNAEGLI